MFLHLSVILFLGEFASVNAGIPPPWEQTLPGSIHPLEQTPRWEQTPRGQTPPLRKQTPPQEADTPQEAYTPPE